MSRLGGLSSAWDALPLLGLIILLLYQDFEFQQWGVSQTESSQGTGTKASGPLTTYSL